MSGTKEDTGMESGMNESGPVVILDFGSQYTQLIARRVREQHVYCEIHPCTKPLDEIWALRPPAVILSGGPASVYGEGAPTVDPALFERGVPVLGICYGMQLMCHLLGGKVERADEREYGPATISVERGEGLLLEMGGEDVDVWMSHGDRVASIPDGFEVSATSPNSPFAAVADPGRRFFGVQFHPEVGHTKRGADMLRAFLVNVVGAPANWTPENFATATIRKVKEQIGDANAICGLSGGVDSSVAAMLVHRAIGDRLTCVFVDNGLLRAGEAEEVVAMFRGRFDLKLIHVDARDEFLNALAGETDPERKRKIIGRVFIEVFDREARALGERGEEPTFLVQGTLYPDVIESVSFKGPSATIKSHHNVGGLPDHMKLKLCEPLRLLFKDEVREVGTAMGLPRDLLWRQPFPGPGLAIRCPGEVTRERLRILRDADVILDAEVRAAGLYESLWQSFCVLVPVRTVGVMGDERTYDYVIAIRAVTSSDGMTADWARLPYELLAKVSSRIINEVRGCNRVCYDISSKPPATIEWE